MNIEIQFGVSENVWAVFDEETYRNDEITCSNCNGSGKIRISPSASLKCRRCRDGVVLVEYGERWKVEPAIITDITVSISQYRPEPKVEYTIGCRYQNRHVVRTNRIFRDTAEAKAEAELINSTLDTQFESRKQQAMIPVDLEYDISEATE